MLAHEQRHVNDINEIVAAANSSWGSKPPFTASAPRKAGVQKAVDNLRLEIEKAERDHCDRITSEIEKRAAEFHAIAPEIPPLDCWECLCHADQKQCPSTGSPSSATDCCYPGDICCKHPDGIRYVCCTPPVNECAPPGYGAPCRIVP